MKLINIFKYWLLSAFTLISITVIAQPVVSSFTPTAGFTGSIGSTLVTINGSGFSTTPGNNIVFFGAVSAVANTASATQLTVTAPAGATFKALSVLNLETGLTGYNYSQNPFVSTFYNEGNMIFSSTAAFSYTDKFNAPYFRMADIDGDGKTDIVYVDSSRVSVIRNISTSGAINFDTSNIYFTSSFSNINFLRGISISDLTGDGKPEIVICGNGTTNGNANINIYQNLSSPGTVNLGGYFNYNNLNSKALGYDLVMTDLDKDGKTDIIISQMFSPDYTGDGSIIALKNEYSVGGGFAFSAIEYLIPGAQVNNTSRSARPTNLVAADFDNDNLVDIGIVFNYLSYDSNFVNIVYNSSSTGTISFAGHSGKFSLGLGSNTDVDGGNIFYAKAVDLDDDGKPDMSSTNFQGNNIVTLLNLGNRGAGNLATRIGVPIGLGSQPSALAIGDLDGNGKPDLAASGSATNNVVVQRNNAVTGNIRVAARRILPVLTSPKYLEIGDVDGDGLPDLIVSGTTNLAVYSVVLKTDKIFPAKLPF